MEFVQVIKQDLLEYIAYTEALIEDHNRLELAYGDSKKLADLVREDYESKIDKLRDKMLDESVRSQYHMGLMDAYKIMKGRG